MTRMPRAELERDYERTAQEYLRSLPLENHAEAVPQARQRIVFLMSFPQIAARRSDIHYFNELLVQYEQGRPPRRRQVVPDNMVVLYEGEITAHGSYDVPLQPAGPLFVLEYVSKSSKRKDYEDSYRKYERELKVPYYLVFYPDNQEWTLFRRGKMRYSALVPDANGRCAIPELELEVGLIDGWVRFWFRGELIALPAEVQRHLAEEREQRKQAEQRLAHTEEQLARALREIEHLRHQRGTP